MCPGAGSARRELAAPAAVGPPFILLAVALALALFLVVMPARRGAHVLLSVEGTTVALIHVVTVVVLVRLHEFRHGTGYTSHQ